MKEPLEESSRRHALMTRSEKPRLPLGEVPPRRGAARRLAHRGCRGVAGRVLGPPRHRAQLGHARRGRQDLRGDGQVLRPDLPELAPQARWRYGTDHRRPYPRTTRRQHRRERLGVDRSAGGRTIGSQRPRRCLPLPFRPQRPTSLGRFANRKPKYDCGVSLRAGRGVDGVTGRTSVRPIRAVALRCGRRLRAEMLTC